MAEKKKELVVDNLAIVDKAVIGLDIQEDFYVEAVKEHKIPDIEDILAYPKEYQNYYDENGEIKAQLLKNETYLVDGKNADELFKLGGRYNYMKKMKMLL